MRLYHHPMSSNARRARMTAIHLGLPLELAEVDLMNADDRRRLAELNPNGKVPVLADGAFLLWESCAIMQYLAEQVPGQTIYPQAPQARADVNRWLFWATQHFAPAISVLSWERAWKGMTGNGPADPLEEARGERELHECAVVLDAHLAAAQLAQRRRCDPGRFWRGRAVDVQRGRTAAAGAVPAYPGVVRPRAPVACLAGNGRGAVAGIMCALSVPAHGAGATHRIR